MHNIDTITIYFIMIAFYFWGLHGKKYSNGIKKN